MKTLKNSPNPQNTSNTPNPIKIIFESYLGVHKHDVLVDVVNFSENGKIQISPKLEPCRANQDQIRNQRPRLRRNTLFLVRKAVKDLIKYC